MTKKVLTVMLSLAMLSVSLMAVTGPGMGYRGMKHTRFGLYMAEKNLFSPRMLLKFQDDIGLTKDQVIKIEKLQTLYHESLIRQNADIQVKELKISDYLNDDQINRKKMETMIREVAAMKTDMKIAHLNHLLDVKSLLTAEQITKIEDLKKDWRNRNFRQWRRPGRGGMNRGNRSGQGFGGGNGAGGGPRDGSGPGCNW